MVVKQGIVLIVLVSLLLPACVSKAKYEELELKLENQKTATELAQQNLKDAQGEIQKLSLNRYSTYQHGQRRWRLDTSTGETCILETSVADWHQIGTVQESCSCQDATERWAGAAGTRGEETLKKSMDLACTI